MSYFRFAFFLSLLGSTFILSAQKVTIIESEQLDGNHVQVASVLVDDQIISLAIDNDSYARLDNGMVTSVWNNAKYYDHVEDRGNMYIEVMDTSLKEIKHYPLKIKDASELNILGMTAHQGRITLYYAKRKSFDNDASICAMIIDTQRWRNHRERVLLKINRDQGMPASRLIQSPSGEYLSVVSEPYHGNEDEQTLNVLVAHVDGNVVWKDKVTLGKAAKAILISDAAIDDHGNVYVSYKSYSNNYKDWTEKIKGEKQPTYTAKVVSYDLEGSEIVLSLDNEGKYLRHCNIAYDAITDQLRIMGTYSVKDKGNISGIYESAINAQTFEKPTVKYTPFKAQFIEEMDQDGIAQTKEKDPGIEYRDMDASLLTDGDILYYVLQPYRIIQRATSMRRRGMMHYTYDTNIRNIIAIKSQQGEVNVHRIPRKITREIPLIGLLGIPMIFENELVIVYSDSDKNLKRDMSEKAAYSGDPHYENLVYAYLTPNNELGRAYLLNEDDYDFKIHLKDCQKVGEKYMRFTNDRGGFLKSKRRVGLVIFE